MSYSYLVHASMTFAFFTYMILKLLYTYTVNLLSYVNIACLQQFEQKPFFFYLCNKNNSVALVSLLQHKEEMYVHFLEFCAFCNQELHQKTSNSGLVCMETLYDFFNLESNRKLLK